jgi:hypothetical protein
VLVRLEEVFRLILRIFKELRGKELVKLKHCESLALMEVLSVCRGEVSSA